MNGVRIKENHFATSLKWHCEVLRMSRLSCFPISVYFKKYSTSMDFPTRHDHWKQKLTSTTAEVRYKSGKSFIRVNR